MRLLPLLLLVSCHRVATSRIGHTDAPHRVYEIRPGDTLTWIADDFGVAGGWPELAALNRIREPDLIFSGSKLRIPTNDERLPRWPEPRPADRFEACEGAPIAPAVARPVSGCRSATCVDLGGGYAACGCDDARLVLARGGAPVWSAEAEPRASWWYDPDTAPEPPGALVATRHELDGDAAPEVAVAWRRELNDLGMSRWEVAVFDGPISGAAPVTFEAANWGVGSVVRGERGCELLATEWTLADEPGRDGDGWYLVGRRHRFANGALHATDAPVVARRLLESFAPGARRIGAVLVGTPAGDLSVRAQARDTEPGLELAVADWAPGRVSGARVLDGALELTIGGVSERVDPDSGTLRRLGDRATGRLYPPGYTPADPRRLVGRDVLVTRYGDGWVEPWGVVWLGAG